MATALFYDDIFTAHNPGSSHPENAKRLQVIKKRLETEGLWHQLYSPVTFRCDETFLAKNHTHQHIQRVFAACKNAPSSLDPDTVVSERSCEAAVVAASAAAEATNQVMADKIANAFCLLRPPGHHAEPDRAMGFCLFNNIALAAHNLLDNYQLDRILIIDWDVHHGNGTQEAFYEDPRVFFLSFHQYPLYPGTGQPENTGNGKGKGFNRNVTFAPNTESSVYYAAFAEITTAVFESFKPQFVLISAGFDAHKDDPLAQLRLTEQNFADMTAHVKHLAEEFSNGRLVSCLEGGYNLQALSDSVLAHVATLNRPKEETKIAANELRPSA